MSKTITREQLDAAVAAGWGHVLDGQADVEKMAERMFEAAGYTVEPKPILPDVTGGEWHLRETPDLP